ncbi:Na+/H+ antiporter [Bryobacterales bacterium F-183]|nr:Na+/H+ antiporter [Bryobacterales bacterium F-183]
MSATVAVELVLLLLLAVSAVALLTSRWRVPYTIALVFAGFAIDLFHVPIKEVAGNAQLLTPEIIFTLFLPALLFESAMNLDIRTLRENLASIILLAVVGVGAATAITGLAIHQFLGLPVLVSLLFGALISATDPIAVIALFRELGVSKRLAVIVEGESLFNDGTAAVVFQLILAGILTGQFDPAEGVRRFLVVALGGVVVGLVIGFAVSKITAHVDEPRIEITLTTIVAYGSYLLAEHLHVSGVLSTVMAGLTIGNYGALTGMSPRTRVAVWSFWEYVAFLANSLVFLLIGIEVHVAQMLESWWPILMAIGAVLIGRTLTVYLLTPLSARLGPAVPRKWNPVLVWGGLRGSVSIALALSLPQDFPHRATLLTLCFGAAAFSIVVQGLTMKPLLQWLGILETSENVLAFQRTKQIALNATREELESLRSMRAISNPAYEALTKELENRTRELEDQLHSVQQARPEMVSEEIRFARLRLLATEQAAVRRGMNEGLIPAEAGEHVMAINDEEIDKLSGSAH